MIIEINPVEADRICRQALKEYAEKKGLDTTKQYGVENWHWYLNKQHCGLNSNVIFTGERK